MPQILYNRNLLSSFTDVRNTVSTKQNVFPYFCPSVTPFNKNAYGIQTQTWYTGALVGAKKKI